MSDCLIVGGGVIGLSLAWELSGHGMSVQVIDQGEMGKEASWAGAGILPPAKANERSHSIDQLRALSHRLHPEWARRLVDESGIDTGFRRCGGLYLARSAGEAAALSGWKGMLDEEGIAVQRLAPDALVVKEPSLAHLVDSGSLKSAYWLPDEAQLRNPRHLQALREGCRRRGVRFSENVELVELDLQDGRARRAVTTTGIIEADRYCICSGAWTHLLLKRLGNANGIIPIRGQMVLYRCPEPPLSSVVNEGPRYLVPREDGWVLVGSSEEEVGFDTRTTDDCQQELRKLAREILPQLTDDRIEKSWAGLRPGSFDGFPYMGAVPEHHNVFVAAGHFRSGLTLSPGTAVVMSQLIRGEQPEIDLSPFRVGRG